MQSLVNTIQWSSWALGGLASTAFLWNPAVRESVGKFSRSTDRPWPLIAALWVALAVFGQRAITTLAQLPILFGTVVQFRSFGAPMGVVSLLPVVAFALAPIVIGLVILLGVDWERFGNALGRPIAWIFRAVAALMLGSAALWPFTLPRLVLAAFGAVRWLGTELPRTIFEPGANPGPLDPSSSWSIPLSLLLGGIGYLAGWYALRGSSMLSARLVARNGAARFAIAVGSIGLLGQGLDRIAPSVVWDIGASSGPSPFLPLAVAIALGLWAAATISFERVRQALGVKSSVLLEILVIVAFAAVMHDVTSMVAFYGSESALFRGSTPLWWLLSAIAIIYAVFTRFSIKELRA